jgi:superfamily II DNA or RNA helicase
MILRPYQSEIVAQVKQAFHDGYRHPCIVAPCGAGKTVLCAEIARKTTLLGNRVLFLVHRQELIEQTETTFRKYGVDMRYCQIAMVQTITRRLPKTSKPKLIITDESHHSLAVTYRRIYDHWPDVHTIGITATPCRLGGGGLGEINDILIQGVTTKYLIDNHYLAPFDYYAPALIDVSGLHTKAGDYVAEESFAHMDKPAIYGDVIRHYNELSGGQKAICYCASIAHSMRMAEEFQASGIPAAHIDGGTSPVERSYAVEKFRSGFVKVLTNVGLVSEGFDVPDCGVSILLRPTKSLTLYIQQSMRCMRYMPDKKAVIIDHVGNYTRFGLPDQDRTWTLDVKQAEKRKPEISVRQCPQCYYTHETAPMCPKCGFEYPAPKRTLEEVKEARLQKIQGFVADYKQPGDCRSFEELRAYGKLKGYKNGWAWHQAKVRGYI